MNRRRRIRSSVLAIFVGLALLGSPQMLVGADATMVTDDSRVILVLALIVAGTLCLLSGLAAFLFIIASNTKER